MADQYPQPNLLVEPAELAKPEVAMHFVILDARDWAAGLDECGLGPKVVRATAY